MKAVTRIMWVAALMALLSACSGLGSAGASLSGTSWTLTQINGGAPIAGRDVTLQFERQKVAGSAGCNSFEGGYSFNASTITFTEVFSTMMACPEAGVMNQEQAYLDALNTAAVFSIQGDTLTVGTAADPAVLVFARVK